MDLFFSWDEIREFKRESKTRFPETEYWKSEQTSLGTAIILVHQGTEFLLKARITATSPYLLIASSPRDWPRASDKKDIPFSDFRTIQAQELVKVHDTVYPDKLPGDFKQIFDDLRAIRNKLMHTVDKDVATSAKEVLQYILHVSNYLLGQQIWIRTREIHLFNTPHGRLFESDFGSGYATLRLSNEIQKAIKILDHKTVLNHFGLRKRQMSYYCPFCIWSVRNSMEAENFPKLAYLSPNTKTSTQITCLVCQEKESVIRKACSDLECTGNVIFQDENRCLSCYRDQ